MNDKARMEIHGKEVGAPSEETVEQRAQEIARIEGRPPDAVTEEDRRQALQELHGEGVRLSTESPHADVITSRDPAKIAVDTGHENASIEDQDEQELMEREVKEGMREAEHERMVEGQKNEQTL
jgi:hypothetical protein